MNPARHTRRPALLLAALILAAATRASEIHDAAEAEDVARITSLLATNRDLVRLAGKDDMTPLHSAARVGKMKAVAVLVERGADINAPDIHGCTPLYSAVYGGHTLVAEFLLDHKANVNAARTNGTTALYFAASLGDTNVVGLLLKRGAKPDARPEAVSTPLHAAVKVGHLEVVKLLVAAGAKLEATDQDGRTPLHLAAKEGDRAMVEWLLNRGADAEAKDRLRMRPVDYVTGAENDALVSLLEQQMKSSPDQSLPSKVGEAGDPDRLMFEGAKTFTSGQIQHALAVKPSYLLAAHPQANMRAFLEELKDMVQAGYQAAGFPDARAEISYDAKSFRVHVKVTEGPRFKAAKIRVVGAKSSSAQELESWFTTSATAPKTSQTVKSASTSTEAKEGTTWTFGAGVNVNEEKRSGLNTPGKAMRPDDPMWISGDPADFSASWVTQAVAQVESCLAEQGFFFPKAKVELSRNISAGSAELLITLQSEGPPGVIGEINVTGMRRDTRSDIVRFLDLREGMKITAERLAVARQKLRDSGRFQDFEITPEYSGVDAAPSRRVNLSIEVKEQEGVPRLNEPLSPTQQALVRLCEWIEQFPSRDEDIQITVSNHTGVPFAVDFVLSPKRGLLLNSADLEGASPVSAGFLLSEQTAQFCAWASGSKVAASRQGGGSFFLHLQPNRNEGSNRFNISMGAGYRGNKDPAKAAAEPPLTLDVQLSRAAFLDLLTRDDGSCRIEAGQLIVSNDTFCLRAEAATGRFIEANDGTNQPAINVRIGVRAWDSANRDFLRRAAQLTNHYAPGRGQISFLTLAATEAIRWKLTAAMSSSVSPEQRARALSALRKLLNPEVLSVADRLFGGNETNTFSVPMDDVDRAMAQNSVAALFSGFAFEWSGELFPKYSWPWTIAREATFVMVSEGRYTDVELERLYNSEDTGPIGCLAIATLLAKAGSPPAKTFALQGIMRLSTQDFLRDCDLFLRGESGLARSFGKLAEVLRTLPEDELTALVAVLPEAEANLLRESAAALRASPEASPGSVLAPAIGKYWEHSLRAAVRDSLRRLTTPPKGSGTAKI